MAVKEGIDVVAHVDTLAAALDRAGNAAGGQANAAELRTSAGREDLAAADELLVVVTDRNMWQPWAAVLDIGRGHMH